MSDSSSDNSSSANPNARLSALAIYEAVRRDGQEEMARPLGSLWWSGVAAGIAISASVMAKGLLHMELPDSPWRLPIENFGYCVGFVLVILGRMQLFTENTITVVLPLMARPSLQALYCTLRLWTVVFLANMVGTFIAAFMTGVIGFSSPDQMTAFYEVAAHGVQGASWLEVMLKAIPAGFFVAALVWMLPNARGFDIWVIVLPTYIIALGGFDHVIVGSMEAWLLLLDGQTTLLHAVWGFIVPALIGNVLGGTVLFSLLAYGQVRHEID